MEQTARQTDTLIIGASVSGLACAACLQKEAVDYLIIEKQDQVAAPWRRHYERLHLHTSKRFSNLPYKKFAGSIPRYPARQQVLDYLEDYRREFNINPIFNTEAVSVSRQSNYWLTETTGGSFRSDALVMATGLYNRPKPVSFEGMERFHGKILHSCDYKTGKDFSGQRVLVVGFGNSACEIAVDLYEQGALPALSVRSPVNVVPRDVLGIPVLDLSLLLSAFSPRLADVLSAPLMRWLTGDLTRLGLQRKPYGPLEEIRRDGKVPVLDIGTLAHIRKGHIKIYGAIDFIDGEAVHFKDGKKEVFDAIVAAIGYSPNAGIAGLEKRRLEDLQVCAAWQKYFGEDGLYFCGYWVSPTGQFREIAADAKKIANAISKTRADRSH